MDKAIFLDKDGTLIYDIPYNDDPHLIILEPDLIKGLKTLQENGFKLVIITNQAGVALGYFPENRLLTIKSKIEGLVEEEGIRFSGFYYCPHHPNAVVPRYKKACTCRKPQPGLILRAAQELKIDLSRSWMVGDILNDVEAGNRAGCRTVLIDNGHEKDWEVSEKRVPDLLARNINEAAELILIADRLLLPMGEESYIGLS